MLAVACGGSDDEDDSSGGAESVEISDEAESMCRKECDASFTECVTDVDACLSDCRDNAAFIEEHCESSHVALLACMNEKPLSEFQCLDTHAGVTYIGCDDEHDVWNDCMAPYW